MGRPKGTPEEVARRNAKRKLMKQILRNYHTWRAYYEDTGLKVITINGEEWHFLEVLDGMETLPKRQRQAVQLVCIEGYPQEQVAKMMGFTKWSTPVQQYVVIGLDKLVRYHEEQNAIAKFKESQV